MYCEYTKHNAIDTSPTQLNSESLQRKTRWFDAPWLNSVLVQAQIVALHQHDWLGSPFALGFAALLGVVIAGPTSVLEIGTLPFAVVWLLRCIRFSDARRITWALLRQPVTLAFLAWAGWCAALIAYLPSQREAWNELAAARWSWALLALPFVGFARSRWILCIAIGFFCVNVGQLVEAIGHQFHIPALEFKNYPDRLSAWLDPVSGATAMTAALGLVLPLAFMGRGNHRTLAIIASVAGFAGIIATGSRGAWIAASLLVLAVGVATFTRSGSRLSSRSRTMVVAVTLLVALCGGILARGIVVPRFEYAVNDLSRVVNHGDYSSDTGLRLFVAQRAVHFVMAHPMTGVGPGQFQTEVIAAIDPAEESLRARVPAHAHNTILHLAATTGVPGVLLWLLLYALGLRNAWAHASRGGWDTLSAGPFFGLLGLAFVSGTDVVQLNQQSCAMLFVLMGLSPSAPFIFTGDKSVEP